MSVLAIVTAVSPLIEKLIPDKDAANKLAHEVATKAQDIAHAEVMAQMEVNKAEAAHKSLFVAGWRPAIGWICGIAMASNFILAPYLAAFGMEIAPLDLEVMMPVLLGMLGLGGLRTTEKLKKVSREH
jgi:hypothetical protein